MATDYITVLANGMIPTTEREVVITFHGPRGGSRAIESISVDSARKLRDDLIALLPNVQ